MVLPASAATRDWTWPVPNSNSLSSCYGENRGSSTHYALDIAAGKGSSVVAAYGGKVIATYTSCSHNYAKNSSCGCGGGLGNYVYILSTYNGTNYVSKYGHLTKVSVSDGQTVSKGQTIGTVGSTGYSTGFHLDYQLYIPSSSSYFTKSKNVDPLKSGLLSIPSGLNANAASTSCCYTYVKEVLNFSGTDTTISLSGHTAPTSIQQGNVFILKGTISSGTTLTNVTVGVYDKESGGTMKTGKSVAPNSKTYSIANIDAYVQFGKLSAGTYYYRVSATNSGGTKILLNQKFTVTGSHSCNKGEYVYYWKAHPHYNCYKCSICGEIKEDRNSSNYIESCTDCQNHTCEKGKYVYFWKAHPHPSCYECSKCGEVWADHSTTNYFESCDICTAITPITGSVTNITETTAALSGSYKNPAGKNVTRHGFKYGTSKTDLNLDASVARNESYVNGGIPAYTVKSLSPGTTYYYQAYVVAGSQSYYGDVKSFTTDIKVLPTNAKVKTDKSTYEPGDTVTVTPSATGANDYSISVFCGDEKVFSNYTGFTGSISFTADKVGTYRVVVSCRNSAGYVDATCSFTVQKVEEVPPVIPPATSTEFHFPRVATYTQGQFTDVPPSQWFTANVANAVEFGLMKGNSATTFNPYGDVTLAEAITMAARIHAIYTTGTESFDQASGGKWYQVYLDYAYQNGIINNSYYTCDVTKKATRAQYAEIFANSLPGKGLEARNNVADNAIPDVPMSQSYADSVYKLYRAGILTGGDVLGTFSPKTYITRAESATIVARMADTDNRMSFTLN